MDNDDIFTLGKKVIVTRFARLLPSKDGGYREYHSETILNDIGMVVNKRNGEIATPKFITKKCDSMDESGFCSGHIITRDEFINKWCNGIDPLEKE